MNTVKPVSLPGPALLHAFVGFCACFLRAKQFYWKRGLSETADWASWEISRSGPYPHRASASRYNRSSRCMTPLLQASHPMGHNVFLIAQVKARGSQDPAYRCVGGYHKHDCYGSLPLRALLRFFTLLRQSDNADIIREEIHALDGQYGQPGEDPKSPNVPCRFLSTVLGSAWDVLKRDLDIDVGGTYLYKNILSANSKFWGERTSLCVPLCPAVADRKFQTAAMGLPSSTSPIRRTQAARSLSVAIPNL